MDRFNDNAENVWNWNKSNRTWSVDRVMGRTSEKQPEVIRGILNSRGGK